MGVRLVSLDELLRTSDVDLGPPAEDRRRRSASSATSSCATVKPVADPRQRGPRRHRRRGGAVRRAQGGPGRRRRAGRVRHRAVHRLAAVRARAASSPRRTSAPARTRRRRRPVSPSPGRCGWRWPVSWCPDAVNVQGGVDRRGRPARHPAGREAGPGLHRAGRTVSPSSSTSRCAARSPPTTSGCSSSPRSRGCSPTSSRTRCPTSTRRCWRPSAASACGSAPTPTSPDYRNLVTLRGTLRRRHAGVGVRHTDRAPSSVEKLVEVDGFDIEVTLVRPHGRVPLRRPSRDRRHRRPHARRGRRQHRRHAGQPRPPGAVTRWWR